jgi:hypothetical protein
MEEQNTYEMSRLPWPTRHILNAQAHNKQTCLTLSLHYTCSVHDTIHTTFMSTQILDSFSIEKKFSRSVLSFLSIVNLGYLHYWFPWDHTRSI